MHDYQRTQNSTVRMKQALWILGEVRRCGADVKLLDDLSRMELAPRDKVSDVLFEECKAHADEIRRLLRGELSIDVPMPLLRVCVKRFRSHRPGRKCPACGANDFEHFT